MSHLNLDEPHEKFGPNGQEDYIIQDGLIFSWSESNIQYEFAWFLYADKKRLNGNEIIFIENIIKERPIPPEMMSRLPDDGFVEKTK